MKNFLAISHATIEPGPRLNLIIGPNGTGKSSIVNAVCLVFGGKLSLLGRGGDLASYVRYGSKQAFIEAWIYDPDMPDEVKNVKKVRRMFDAEGNDAFFVDGKKMPPGAIAEISRRYDIQLDNLSQFMPQEKFAEFAALRPKALLDITVRSLGGSGMVEKLKEFSGMDRSLDIAGTKIKTDEVRLSNLKDRNDAVLPEVEAFKKRLEIDTQICLAQKVLPHRQARDMYYQIDQLGTEKRALAERVRAIRGRIQFDRDGPLRELERKSKAAKKDFRSSRDGVTAMQQETTELQAEVEKVTTELTSKKMSLCDLEKAEKRHEKLVREAKQKVYDCKCRLERISTATDEEDERHKLAQCRQQKSALINQQYREYNLRGSVEQTLANSERTIKQLKKSRKRLSVLRLQRIQHLDSLPAFRSTSAAVQVVQAVTEAGGFCGRVYGPVVAEISCKDQYHARIMEDCLSGFLIGAFVTENLADSRTLIAKCKKKLDGWAPDIITSPTLPTGEKDERALARQRPNRSVDIELRELGIVAMVSDIYDAPDAVRGALNAQAGLHNIHVGDERAEIHTNVLRYEEGVKTWYSPQSRYSILRSRYDDSVRSLRVDTRFSQVTGRIYSGSVEGVEQEQSRLKQAIRDEEHKLQHAKRELAESTQRLAEIRAKIQDVGGIALQIGNRQRKRSELSLMLKRSERQYANLMARPSVSCNLAKKNEVHRAVVELEKMAIVLASKVVDALDCLKDGMKELDVSSASYVMAAREYEVEKEKNSSMERELEHMIEQYKVILENIQRSKNEYKRKRKEAEDAISESQLNTQNETISVWLQHDTCWLQNEIERLTERMNCLSTAGPSVLVEYEDREQKIRELEKRIRDDKAGYQEQRLAYEKEKREFLNWLHQGVDKMSVKFSNLYERLGCAGDLELTGSIADSLDDMELQILVSHRSGTALRPINTSSISGGEKMCSTILYCFSLINEDTRMPPFVIIDELNQGLDPENEMKIMTIMFEQAEKGLAPQSFVVTPKLLPNLPFHDEMKTHIILNGPILKNEVWTPFQ